MFVDKVKIYCKAGNGGDGCRSFYRSKLVMNGGPDGGDGGKGGNIVFKVDQDMNNLVDFYFQKHYKAENGEKGEQNNCTGKNGAPMIIKVPKGTVVKEALTEKVLADLTENGEEKTILFGGNGGRGNLKFANSVRQAPNFCELGEQTNIFDIMLELKTIADVGLVGFPNVGKSKLLSILTAAKPKIANYDFTTLTPNIGVAMYGEQRFIVADIPGLIEGASEGKGLGFDFLRHIERTRMLVHVVDIASVAGRNPLVDFEKINNELKIYSEEVANLPQIVVLNKIDLLTDNSIIEEFKNVYGANYKIICLSCAMRTGIDELLQSICEVLSTLEKPEKIEIEEVRIDKVDNTQFNVQKLDNKTYSVIGPYVDRLSRNVIISEPESFAYFQKRLKNDGVIDALKQKGAQEGDTIIINYIEFEFFD